MNMTSIAPEDNRCRHYNGSYHNKTCLAGVCYRDVTPKPDEPGSAYRIPCKAVTSGHGLKVLQETGPQGTCRKFENVTAEDIAADEEAMAKAMERMMATIPLCAKVKAAHKGENWSGTDVCPVCKGVIRLSHAGYNGHVHGRCETADCVSFME